MESGKSFEQTPPVIEKPIESEKRETSTETVANFLLEKYDLKVTPKSDDLTGVTMFLQKEGCEIRVSFHGYRRISDIDVEVGDRALIENIVSDLENKFTFIDQNEGTVDKGHIRVHYPNNSEE